MLVLSLSVCCVRTSEGTGLLASAHSHDGVGSAAVLALGKINLQRERERERSLNNTGAQDSTQGHPSTHTYIDTYTHTHIHTCTCIVRVCVCVCALTSMVRRARMDSAVEASGPSHMYTGADAPVPHVTSQSATFTRRVCLSVCLPSLARMYAGVCMYVGT
jgi:hypothetical protein